MVDTHTWPLSTSNIAVELAITLTSPIQSSDHARNLPVSFQLVLALQKSLLRVNVQQARLSSTHLHKTSSLYMRVYSFRIHIVNHATILHRVNWFIRPALLTHSSSLRTRSDVPARPHCRPLTTCPCRMPCNLPRERASTVYAGMMQGPGELCRLAGILLETTSSGYHGYESGGQV
jgi:hypothetical protein